MNNLVWSQNRATGTLSSITGRWLISYNGSSWVLSDTKTGKSYYESSAEACKNRAEELYLISKQEQKRERFVVSNHNGIDNFQHIGTSLLNPVSSEGTPIVDKSINILSTGRELKAGTIGNIEIEKPKKVAKTATRSTTRKKSEEPKEEVEKTTPNKTSTTKSTTTKKTSTTRKTTEKEPVKKSITTSKTTSSTTKKSTTGTTKKTTTKG